MRKSFTFDLHDENGGVTGQISIGESDQPNTINLDVFTEYNDASIEIPRKVWEEMTEITASYRADFKWALPQPKQNDDGPQAVHPALVPVLDSADDDDTDKEEIL